MLMGLIEVDVVMTQLGGALRIFKNSGRISFRYWVFPWGLSQASYQGGVLWKGLLSGSAGVPSARPLTSGLGSHGLSV